MFSWKGKDLSELDGKKIRKNTPAYIVLGLAVVAMTFFGVCEPTGSRFLGPTGVVASVDGDDISPIEFRRAHIQRTQQAQQQYKDNFDPVKLKLSESVVNGLVDQLIYYKEAVQAGFWATDDEVAQVILDGNYFQGDDGKFDSKLFKSYLRRQGHSEASFTEELRRSLVNEKFRSFVVGSYRVSQEAAKIDKVLSDTKLNVEFLKIDSKDINMDISKAQIDEFLKNDGEEKARKYFDKNTREFRKEGEVKARHILISYEGATRAAGKGAKRKKDDAKQLAEKVLGLVKKGDFEAIAKEYTDEPSGKEKGGDLGFFRRGDMVPAFSEAAFSMKKGEISNIVETNFGFHIIKVDDIRAAINKDFEGARQDIAKKLIKQEQGPQLVRQKAQEIHAAIKAGGDKATLKQLGRSWQSTGEFSLDARFLPGGLGSDPAVREAALKLKKVGDLSDLVEVNSTFYIMKLKSRLGTDPSSLKGDKLKELTDSSGMMDAFWMYNDLKTELKKSYEDGKRVYRNPEFMQYDAILRANSGS